jgi:hypothetical protein
MRQHLCRLLICAAAALSLLTSAAQAQPAKIYRSASTITPGTPVPAGDGVALACSAAGMIRLVLLYGTLDLYAQVGTAIIDNIAVSDVNAANTTATCTVSVLRSY